MAEGRTAHNAGTTPQNSPASSNRPCSKNFFIKLLAAGKDTPVIFTMSRTHYPGADGHHGLKARHSADILFKDAVFKANRTHNIGGAGLMEGCVFTNIDIQTSSGLIDFHGGGFSMANLFENIKKEGVATIKVSGKQLNYAIGYQGKNRNDLKIRGFDAKFMADATLKDFEINE